MVALTLIDSLSAYEYIAKFAAQTYTSNAPHGLTNYLICIVKTSCHKIDLYSIILKTYRPNLALLCTGAIPTNSGKRLVQSQWLNFSDSKSNSYSRYKYGYGYGYGYDAASD